VADPLAWHVEAGTDDGQCEYSERDVDVEHPPPRRVIDEESAQQGPGHTGHTEHCREQALVAASFAGETTSPTIAIAVTIRPPPPSPWMARNAISWPMDCASPQSTEPTRT
jgi:hypothetical protein